MIIRATKDIPAHRVYEKGSILDELVFPRQKLEYFILQGWAEEIDPEDYELPGMVVCVVSKTHPFYRFGTVLDSSMEYESKMEGMLATGQAVPWSQRQQDFLDRMKVEPTPELIDYIQGRPEIEETEETVRAALDLWRGGIQWE